MIETLYEQKLVAIFRGDYRGKWQIYAEALISGGMCILEITLNSPEALQAISQLKRDFGKRILLGAGTALSGKDALAAIDAGAQFIVAPDTDPLVIRACRSRLIPIIPGAYTPTEVKAAYRQGAAMVKLFPATSPEYVKAVHEPLNNIPLMVTGGVNAENAAAFFAAGASALGLGGYLTKATLTPDEVTQRAAAMVAAVKASTDPR